MGKKKPKKLKTISLSKMPLSCSSEIYQFSGLLPAPARSQFSRSKIISLLDEGNKVIGFAVLIKPQQKTDDSQIQGYILNTGAQAPAQIFMGPTGDAYVGNDSLALVTSHNLTDNTWQNGIARNWPGFFLDDTQANRLLLVPGSTLKFADGSYRLLTEQLAANGFLNIRMNGTPLNAESVGYPKPISVVKPACQ